MIEDVYHDLETNIYIPTLCIPIINRIYTPPNSPPDDAVTDGTCIYLHETSHTGPVIENPIPVSVLPLVGQGNQIYGGQVGVYGPRILPRISIEGFMDTPCAQVGEYYIPIVGIQKLETNQLIGPMLYGEVLTMMIEGRAGWDSDTGWERVDPLWYRDGYGRVYNSPRFIDFQPSYVPAIPERTQFSMVLKV